MKLFLEKYIIVLILIFYFQICFSEDQNKVKNNIKQTDGKIHIISDKLIYDSATKSIEFIGNVKANQGSTEITADKVRVYYYNSKKKNLSNESESIEKIAAIGNVKITFDDKIATTQQAEYIVDTKILILNGTDSKVISGPNFVSGSKITLNRIDGKVMVESNTKNRVEAVFYSKEKTLE